MQQLRLLALTAAMTGLIWLAADQRVTRSLVMEVPFALKPAVANSMALAALDPGLSRLRLGFRGPSRAISELRSVQDVLSFELEVSERNSGRYELTLLDEFRAQIDRWSQIPGGVAIVSVTPPSMTIEVDRYVERTVRLVIGKGGFEFDGSERLDPLEVSVKVPGKRFDQLSPDQKVITIAVDRALSGETQDGQVVQKAIPIPRVLDGGLEVVEVEPQHVTFSATLLQRIKTDRLRTVPIRVMAARLDLWNHYELKFSEAPGNKVVTRLIVVRGPTDIVRELLEDASKYNIFGYIQITRDDVQEGKVGTRLPKRVHVLNLPKGVELSEDPEPIEIELVPRS